MHQEIAALGGELPKAEQDLEEWQTAIGRLIGGADRRLFAGLGVSAVYDNIIAEIIIRGIGASLKIGQVNLLGRGE